MGPKKEAKKEFQKRENGTINENKYKIDDALNTDSWKCVVTMAVERTNYDSFILQEFIEGSSSGRRQEVDVIDFNSLVLKILNEFASGELSYKYAFLLNFSSVFQEGVEYINKEIEIPLLLLVKIVKALLFYLKEESLIRIEKSADCFPDPIKAMAERPSNADPVESKKKDVTKKGDSGLKIKPQSVAKQDTELLKRGERAKGQQIIQDAPTNPHFQLHVLLTGFYNPDFPLELIKANIPLHAVICIDSSQTGMREDPLFENKSFQKLKNETKSTAIENFWKNFLKKIWDPQLNHFFRDTIFHVYLPPKLTCDRKKLREFLYRELSYLMYNLSDLKRQLKNYLDHVYLKEVECKQFEIFPRGIFTWSLNLPNECISVPIVLRCIIDDICGRIKKHPRNHSSSIDSGETDWESYDKDFPLSKQATYGSCRAGPQWSEELEQRGDINLLKIYLKTKELDLIYDLLNKNIDSYNSEKEVTGSQPSCNFQSEEFYESTDEIQQMVGGTFSSYWKKHKKHTKTISGGDNCLYPFLMTKVTCPYEVTIEMSPVRSNESVKNDFEISEDLTGEFQKPHFTVTDGSRDIIQPGSFMKTTSKDFFRPEELKIVTPETIKASSAPEFVITPGLKIQTLYTSEIFPGEMTKNPLENLKGFVSESLFLNTNHFDFLEILNKSKLQEKEYDNSERYNCVDDAYSHWNDCVFLTLHNRKNPQGIHHEAYNKMLRTSVGLRDFYDYVLEDEAEWLALEEQSYNTKTFLSNRILSSGSLKGFSDSFFWWSDSLKLKTHEKKTHQLKEVSKEIKTEWSNTDDVRGKFCIGKSSEPFEFFGYNVSDTAVQFSGLKTVYYTHDSSVSVVLTERLYGAQDLGVHVTEASHTLHLYSYACPEPHLLHPFTFHVTFKNGIVLAFGRVLTKTVDEDLKSSTEVLNNENSSKPEIVVNQIQERNNDNFVYNMSCSLPNGLFIQTVEKYIKQSYLVDYEEIAKTENSRLFLSNGNLIKMMNSHTVEILKANGTIIRASLSDLRRDENNGEHFTRYEVTYGEGRGCVFENEKITSERRFQVFQNTDVETSEIFFRRRDGTYYMLQSNGSLCVQFPDGTKMSSSVFVTEHPVKEESNDDEETDFVFVYTKTITEHPDYATVVHDGQTREWNILLPQNSTIKIYSNGSYGVDIDEQTELKVEEEIIRMNNISKENENQTLFTADLSVFEKNTGTVYCRMKDENGKTFIVEGNSKCYVLDEEIENDSQKEYEEILSKESSEVSNFIASDDLENTRGPPFKSRKLQRENKYFIMRRDLTGGELVHLEDAKKILTKTEKGSLVYTQNIPGTENRCFVLVTPKPKRKIKKWGVESILPNPKCEPDTRKKTTSTTYGDPPSWMHPFPKRKFKFVVPQPLTCRVFVETQNTQLTPGVGSVDCHFCEMAEEIEPKLSLITPEGVEEYLKKLSEDDQDLLTEIYSLAASSLLNEKKRSKSTNSEKLEHYLEMSRYYVTRREYHKRCIRYHIIPNYFQHPVGMSWLILNELVTNLKLPDEKSKGILQTTTDAQRCSEYSSSESSSKDEIEYNLSVESPWQSSTLSYRSDVSAETAPADLRTGGICRCKVKAPKTVASTIPVWNPSTFYDPTPEDPLPGICEIQENDMQNLGKKECETREVQLLSLEDLMYLGLV